MAALRVFLRLGAREWNGRGRVIHSTSESVTPNSTQKRKTLLQFLSDHFHDIQALREYWLQKQILKVNQNNRSFTNIQKKYGPYIRGAFFILNQGGAVKYRSCHGVMWEGGASLRLKELVPGLQFVIYKSLSNRPTKWVYQAFPYWPSPSFIPSTPDTVFDGEGRTGGRGQSSVKLSLSQLGFPIQ